MQPERLREGPSCSPSLSPAQLAGGIRPASLGAVRVLKPAPASSMGTSDPMSPDWGASQTGLVPTCEDFSFSLLWWGKGWK